MATTKRNTKIAALKELVSEDRDLMKALMKEVLKEVLEGDMSGFLGAHLPFERQTSRIDERPVMAEEPTARMQLVRLPQTDASDSTDRLSGGGPLPGLPFPPSRVFSLPCNLRLCA